MHSELFLKTTRSKTSQRKILHYVQDDRENVILSKAKNLHNEREEER